MSTSETRVCSDQELCGPHALEAECDRYREALEAIRDFEDTFGGPAPEDAMQQIARDALS